MANGRPLELKAVNLNDIVQESSELLDPTIQPDSQYTVKYDLRSGGIIRGHRTSLYRIFQNLILNARDAMPDGGEIIIKTEDVDIKWRFERQEIPPGKYAKVSISDTGPGIETSEIPSLFDPYFSSKQSGKNYGLGLAIVQNLVKHHNAFIDVSSQVGKGASFNIYFPAPNES